MTTTDMLNRINDALRTGDWADLETLAAYTDGLMIDETEKQAWLALIETACECLNGLLA